MRKFIRLDDVEGNTLVIDVSHITAFMVEEKKVTIVLDSCRILTMSNYNQIEVDVAIKIWTNS